MARVISGKGPALDQSGVLIRADQLARFAPVVTFARWEQFFPCSIDWLLAHSALRDWSDRRFMTLRPTQADLYQRWQFDSAHRYYLDVFGGYSGEPVVRGVRAPMYVTARSTSEFIEITYLMLYAYQGAQTFAALRLGRPFLCVVEDYGSHAGDLEWICVRTTTDLQKVLEVGFEAHGQVHSRAPGSYAAEGDHPIVRVSLNGHAWLPAVDLETPAGMQWVPTHTVRGVLATVDVTTDPNAGEVVWRPFEHAHGLVMLGLDGTGEPIGDQVWARFAGRLGGRRTYQFRRATRLDGTRLSRDEWLYVSLLARIAHVLRLIPARYRSGIGPAGPGDPTRHFVRGVQGPCAR